MKRILILTSDFGYGHRSTAKAIVEALQETHGGECTVEVVNPLDDPRAPAFLQDHQHGYDHLVRESPQLYKVGYEVGETRVAGGLLSGTWTVTLFRVLRDLVHQRQPDVIVCTYLFYQGILSAVFAADKHRIPLLTVVTDLATVNRAWFHPASDLCLVPTQAVYDLAIGAGLPASKVKITGIPVRPELAQETGNRAVLREKLGWRPDLFTVLAVGSKRVEHLDDALRAANHFGLPLQLVVVAGGDEERFRRLQQTEWHVEARVYDYVSDMGSFMKAADCVLSKAGGLIVSESLACGLPMILIDVIPGQETGNADQVVAGNAGVLARDPLEVLESLCHWLENDRALYHRQADNARRMGRPRAALDVADCIWSAAAC